MERKTRIWLGLGAAVLVGGTTPGHALTGAGLAPTQADAGLSPAATPAGIQIAQAEADFFVEGGEGGGAEGGEGGGQVLGTITEFRLTSTDPNAFQYDASAQVAAYGAVVEEKYVAARDAALAMQAAINALLADPTDASLAAARAAWIAARAAYMPTEAFLFYAGPVDGVGGPVKRLNAFPIDPAFIDYVAGDPDAGLVNDPSIAMNRATIVRMDQVGELTDVTTGWHAIEFMLWGEDVSATGPGARPATDFVAGQGNNDRRRDYLTIITQLLVNDLTSLVAAWTPGTNNYRGAILAMDQRNAIGRAFNGMAVLAGYEVGLKRIGTPLRRGEAFEQSRFSDNTTADNIGNLAGVRAVYFGHAAGISGAGFDALVASVDPALNDRIVAALAAAEAAVGALGTPFEAILATPADAPERAAAAAAVAALKELADALRAAGNRLGVLVVIPGI